MVTVPGNDKDVQIADIPIVTAITTDSQDIYVKPISPMQVIVGSIQEIIFCSLFCHRASGSIITPPAPLLRPQQVWKRIRAVLPQTGITCTASHTAPPLPSLLKTSI